MQTYQSARRSTTFYDGIEPAVRHFPDATAGVVLALLFSYLLPARLVFPPLSAVGRPGIIISVLLLVWWLLSRLHPDLATRGRQPMRWALAAYLATLGASYIAAVIRGMDPLEENSAGRWLLTALAGAGILLATADGVLTRDRLDQVLRVYCWGAALMAVIALSQFALNDDWTVYLKFPPFLQFHAELVGFDNRGGGGLFRVAGTAGHFIEFSVLMVLGMLICIHLARFSDTRRRRNIYAVLGMVQASVIPISLSRTGILALFVAVLLLILVWPMRTSLNVLALGVVLAAMVQTVKPGLLATLRALIFAGSEDPSIQGRLDDYEYVRPFIEERFWFGRGVGTFIPELYQLLDNQWLLSLVSTGAVGVAGLALFFGTGIVLAGRVRRLSVSARDRDLATVLAVAVGVAAITAFTFDALYFSTYLITVHFLLGLIGALWRLTRADRLNAVRPLPGSQERKP